MFHELRKRGTSGVMAQVLAAGAPLDLARAAAIMLHGRGGSAEDILSLAAELGFDDIAYLAPQAANAHLFDAASGRRI